MPGDTPPPVRPARAGRILTAYVLIETTHPHVIVHRRGDDGAFTAEVYQGLDAAIPFADVGCTLRLSELYDRVDFTAAKAEDVAEEVADPR